METTLYDLGYNDLKKADDLAKLAQALNAVVADVRYMPHTRNPEFSQTHLIELLGKDYVHIRELGNENYRGDGIHLVDVDKGMMLLHSLLSKKSVILICACWDRPHCHRLGVTQEYERRYNLATQPLTRQKCREIIMTNSIHQPPLL